MKSVVALGAVTVGINLAISSAELYALGLTPGNYTELTVERMEAIRLALKNKRGTLPTPSNGGSVGNTTAFLGRAGIRCSMMGVGGTDDFGTHFVANIQKSLVAWLSELQDGAVTGYDFYFFDEHNTRTIILTHGANALLSPDRIDATAIQQADLLLLDGGALTFGPHAQDALSYCIQTAQAADVPYVLTLSSTSTVNAYRAFFNKFAPMAKFVAGNREQTAVLLGLDSHAALGKVQDALAQTAINAIATLDADGVFARINDAEWLMPTQKVAELDSTGAGDNFLGAFLAAREMGCSVPHALAVGNVVSAEILQHTSAQLPLNVDIPELMHSAIASYQPSRAL